MGKGKTQTKGIAKAGVLVLAAWVCAFVSPANADWRKDLGTFRIGISATDSAALSPEQIGKMQSAFASALGMPAEIIVLRDYAALIDAQASSRIEYAVYSALSYATAWTLCECVEPLVAPVLTGGATGIRSILIINAGSPFTRLDLNGIRIGMPDKDSASGYAVPMAQYMLGTRRLTANEAFFKKLPDMSAISNAFVEGQIDGFFGWTMADANGPIASSGIMGTGVSTSFAFSGKTIETKIPWTSELLRFGPHTIRRNVPTEAKAALKDYFAGLSEVDVDLFSQLPPTNIAGFVPATQAEYATALSAAKASADAAD